MSDEKTSKIPYRAFVAIAVGLLLNLLGSGVAARLGIPLYLDSVGTVFAAAFGGCFPAMTAGFCTNLIKATSDPASLYYGSINVLIAVIAYESSKNGSYGGVGRFFKTALKLALVGGILGSILTLFLYGPASEGITAEIVRNATEATKVPSFVAQVGVDFVVDFADKVVSLAIASVLLVAFGNRGTDDPKLHDERFERSGKFVSVRTKITTIVSIAMAVIATSAIAISVRLFIESSMQDYSKIAIGAATAIANELNPDRIDEFIEKGPEADGYDETMSSIQSIRDGFPDVEYAYVYKVQRDGCHVAFDADSPGLDGAEHGTVIEFDESFEKYREDLIAGNDIPTIATNDTYGWLLTSYVAVRNSAGDCVCYAAADVPMTKVRDFVSTYAAKMISMFAGFFAMFLYLVLWYSSKRIAEPINAVSESARAFAFGSDEERKESMERLSNARPKTNDEIEELGEAFAKTMSDCSDYLDAIEEQADKMERMQSGLVSILADVIESRDKFTGDHVRKTSAYVNLIMDELSKGGPYAEAMTRDFMETVSASAPLHDVGKIRIPDAILNKPGRLTEEEYETMKTHATEGDEIIESALELVPDADSLRETGNLAKHHHERWDGNGYPDGLKGEEIPLSARIMSVADVFDALVSKRSYKEGMPFDKAFSIIEAGSGTQFDPEIVRAFMNRREDAEKIARTSAAEIKRNAKERTNEKKEEVQA